MVDTRRPNTTAILAQLKDFQRDTVDYVFRRMYLDVDRVPRFLIADEVGLGKTLVARGLVARVIDHLWERKQRIDIVYVCSNTDIARQNINRLNVTGQNECVLPARITLLRVQVHQMQRSRLNFISFTPGTSFDLQGHLGKTTERELLFWLLKEPWSLAFNPATRVLQGNAGIEGFRDHVKQFPKKHTIHPGIGGRFADALADREDLRGRFESLCEQMPRAGAQVPSDLRGARNQLIGELRQVLAQTCLHWLRPDFIILDEFQRFKNLLQDEVKGTSGASQLAQHLFTYQESQADPATAARVLLLSATPYKMYTLANETGEDDHSENLRANETGGDDHYEDLRRTLDFLTPKVERRQRLYQELRSYREELFRLTDLGTDGLIRAKGALEGSLRRVMVRTERLALSADRNGMLTEVVPERIPLSASDVQQYLSLQRVARLVEHHDVMDYWKSAPYLLNFMEGYDLKRKINSAVEATQQEADLVEAVAALGTGLLRRREIERYRPLDPGNARLRHLHQDTIARGAWRLLWISPALPYYQGAHAFTEPELARFTKRLIFSCWRVVPKAVAAVLSYEAERCMIRTCRKRAHNTPETRKKRRPLLRFTFREGKPTGMPVLALIYPCRTLAARFDPLQLSAGPGLTLNEVIEAVVPRINALLAPVVARLADVSKPSDEAWYWAAPILLDREYDAQGTADWFGTAKLEQIWASAEAVDRHITGRAWRRHIDEARRVALGREAGPKLGPPPGDLAQVLAHLAIAGPGVAALRCLGRVAPGVPGESDNRRRFAAPLAHAFLHLFNLPEVMALLRGPKRKNPYWRSVLEYCAAGNLQAVLDEYAHVLVESLGLADKPPDVVADGISQEMQRCLTFRTSTVQADMILPGRRRLRPDEPLRFRTRFAMRFGDQEAEDGSEPTRADLVRAAFNSPFWPFVLATTSVGQEGLDFHNYCHAVVHWNLPSNPVDLEQREGRVHRYKGHAVRKNVARKFADTSRNHPGDPWSAMFRAARQARSPDENDLFPFWIVPDGDAKIERHLPALPHSRELVRHESLRRALVLYRMVFGQNRQEDIVHYLQEHLPPDTVRALTESCRIDLAPPRAATEAAEAGS